jgi:predicted outer membrane repeat protein
MKNYLSLLGFALCGSVVAQTTHFVQNLNDSGSGSLRELVSNASAGDLIKFSPSVLNSGSDTLKFLSPISIVNNITIKGLYSASDTLFFSGDNIDELFNDIDSNSVNSISFDSVAIANSVTLNAAMKFDGIKELNIKNSYFNNNEGLFSGVFYLDNDRNGLDIDLTIEKSNFIGNVSNVYGGAISAYTDDDINLTITNSNFENNSSDSYGGAICAYGGVFIDAEIRNTVWKNNSTDSYGGALYLGEIDSTLTILIDRSEFSDNIGGNYGGALSLYNDSYSSDITITNSTFKDNLAEYYGGAIYSYSSYGDTTFTKVNQCSFTGNATVSSAWGGALYVEDYSDYNVNDWSQLSFENNIAEYGGAALIYGYHFGLDADSILFKGNEAADQGGAIYFGYMDDSCYAKMSNITFDSNTTEGKGGAIFVENDNVFSLELENIYASDNSAKESGGVIGVKANSDFYYSERNSEWMDNSTDSNGGVIGIESVSKNIYLNVVNAEYVNNDAADAGGCISLKSDSGIHVFAIDSSVFQRNFAEEGPVFDVDYTAAGLVNGKVHYSYFDDNLGDGGSSIVLESNDEIHLDVDNSTFAYNESGLGGPIIIAGEDSISLLVNNSTWYSNRAQIYGAGVMLQIDNGIIQTEINNSTFYDNQVAQGLGGSIVLWDWSGTSRSNLSVNGSILHSNGQNLLYTPFVNSVFSFSHTLASDAPIPALDSVLGNYFNITDEEFNMDSELTEEEGYTPFLLPLEGSMAIGNGNVFDLSDAQNGSFTGVRSIGAATSNVVSYSCPEVDYCSVQGYSGFDWITNVSINGKELASSNDGGYRNHKNDNANDFVASANEVMNMTLTPGYSYWAFTLGWNIVVDWNQDGDFTDAGERVSSFYGKGTRQVSFTIPDTISAGCYSMRVVSAWGTGNVICGNNFYGEAEDFTLSIDPTQTPQPRKAAPTVQDELPVYDFEFAATNNLVSKGNDIELALRAKNAGNSTFTVTNSLGQVIDNINLSHIEGIQEVKISTENWPTGIYFIGNSKTFEATKVTIQ